MHPRNLPSAATPPCLARLRWLICRLWWCLASLAPGVWAADAPLVLPPDGRIADVWPAVSMLVDTSRTLGIEGALNRRDEFGPPPRTSGSLGVRKEAVWLRVPLVSPVASGNEWIVGIDFAVLNEVDFFLVSNGAVLQHSAQGNLRPFSSRPLQGRTPAVALELDAGVPYELFVRVHTAGAMIVPFTIAKTPVLLPAALREQMLQGVLLGLALCLVIYSFTQWISLRENLFLFYMMLVIGSAGFSLQFFGIGSQFVWGDNTWVETHAAGLSGLLAIAGSFLFMGHALSDEGPPTRFLRAMQAGAAITAALLAAFVLGLIGTRTATAIISVLGPLPSLMSLPVALARVRRGDRISATLLAAWAAYFAAAVVMVALVQGVLPVNFWTLHSFQLGSAADMLLFLGVLAQRSAALRNAAADAVRERDVMRSLAYTDSLTGLSNRRGLQLALRSALAQCSPDRLVAVYLLDLDGFKPINDTHGHDVGDDLLVAVGHRLESCIRHHQGVVARLGGDEFILMVHGLADPAQAHELGLALLRTFEQPIALSHLRLRIGLTIGYALAPLDSEDPQVLIRLADQAMYAGKQSGRGTLRHNA